jgi:glycosyltransferase involved in cell wall biosynthesis
MKILHVHENLAPKGGIETYLLSLIPRLEERGHVNAVAYAAGSGDLVSRSFPIPALSQGGRIARREAATRMNAVIEEWRPDVIHLHNMHNTGALDACMRRAPTVLTGHDFRYVCPASSMFYRRTEEICPRRCGVGCFAVTLTKRCMTPRPGYALQYYRRVRWMAKNWQRLGHLIAPSQAAMDRFVQAGVLASRGTVLPYFCPIEPLKEPRPAPQKTTVVFLGRFSRNKGYEYFIKSLGLLPSSVHGLMIGNVTEESRAIVQRLAEEAGCESRLELRSWASRDEIVNVMRQASLVCFPSIWPETLGIVGLESLACGVPVVASDVGGVREWLMPGQTGLLVAAKDFRGMADAMRQILDSPGMAMKMGEAGLRLIESKFSPESHVDRLVSIYEQVAGQNRSRPDANRIAINSGGPI